MSTISWDHLPDLCVLAIFKYLPLMDLFRSAILVNRQWNVLLQTVLNRRHRLVLVQKEYQLEKVRFKYYDEPDLIERVRREDGSPWVRVDSLEEIKFDALFLPSDDGLLTEQLTSALLAKLPKITHLAVIQQRTTKPNQCSLRQLNRLLDHYYNCLIDLTLVLYSFDADRDDFLLTLPVLFDVINSMHSLRHLNLHLDAPKLKLRPKLSILSQLTSCFIKTKGITQRHDQDWHFKLFRHYKNKLNDGSIDYGHAFPLLQLAGLDPKLGSKFNRISLKLPRNRTAVQPFAQYVQMQQLCTLFSHLTCLSLCNLSISLARLSRCLCKLSRLIELHVDMSETFERSLAWSEEGNTPVESVRLLTLRISISHRDTDRLAISNKFPNLQVFKITACGYPDCVCMTNRAKCVRRFVKPFSACAHLHTVALVDRGSIEFISMK